MRIPLTGMGGSLTALATPFRQTRVDWEALSRMAERQIARGTAALVVCGGTGEAAALTQSEYARAVHAVAEATAGRVPVIAGCTALSTSAAIALGIEAATAGADALLCAVPPYVKPSQEGIFAHIRAIAHATDLPIVLYDVPSRSGVAIADDMVTRLYEARYVVGLKDATADLSRPTRLRARCGDPLMQWSGDDATRQRTGRWAATAASRSPPTWLRRCARCCMGRGTTATWRGFRSCATCWTRCTGRCFWRVTQCR